MKAAKTQDEELRIQEDANPVHSYQDERVSTGSCNKTRPLSLEYSDKSARLAIGRHFRFIKKRN